MLFSFDARRHGPGVINVVEVRYFFSI